MADRKEFRFRQKVKAGELNNAFDDLEDADRNLIADLGLVGITSGLTLSEAAIPNLTLKVGPGTTYDSQGRRIRVPNEVTLDLSQDENGVSTAVGTSGNARVLSIFLSFNRQQLDEEIDGNSQTVYWDQPESYQLHVVKGSEATSGSQTAPPLNSNRILLGDVTLLYGTTAVTNTMITAGNGRRQYTFRTTSGTQVVCGTIKEAVQLLADAIGALVGLSDNTGPDDGATRVGNDAISGATYSVTQGTVKTALVALFSAVNSEASARVSGDNTNATNLTNHLSDATDAHAGSAITNTPAGTIAATTVQGAINELDTDVQGHIANGTGAHAATAVSYPGSGNWADATAVTSTNVKTALDEIVSDLAATAGAGRVGAAAQSGSPTALSAGSAQSQINELLAALNLRALIAREAPRVIGTAGQPAFQNSYFHHVASNRPRCQFFKDGFGAVHVYGSFSNAGKASLTAFTLPAGYIPPFYMEQVAGLFANSNGASSSVWIDEAGNVSCSQYDTSGMPVPTTDSIPRAVDFFYFTYWPAS